ncbi:Uncharacterised protein [Acinetobacter baumannii]|uniref:hypothetical protein n=1 Tax=Acinetobacter baumannii TaxID=470 RepID=UPI000DE5E9CB|nr:hypothetical protein [Acinetobacter baumannii]SSP64945.1 Uncharacterised protein [Acinetobacter baumannii]
MKYSYFLVFITLFFSFQTHATDKGDWWLQREIKLQQNREDYARRVYGRSARSFTETDPVTAKSRTVTRIAIAEATPTASKVGSSMFKRVAFYAKNPGVQMVGVIAVTQLIEAIGWVMEDGAYVKKKKDEPQPPPPNDPSVQYYLKVSQSSDFPELLGKMISLGDNSLCASLKKTTNNASSTYSTSTLTRDSGNGQYYCKAVMQSGSISYVVSFDRYANPNYIPNTPPPEPTERKIPLTPELLGAAMMGEGYSDPVDSTIDSRVNTGQMDGSVASAYEHAGNGVGDELANEMDNKLKNAPPTPDGKAAPFGSIQYKNPPSDSAPNANDRTWDEDGGAADGKAEPITDSQGNPTGGQSISIEFPVFCEWAFTVCKWYDEWKITDDWMRETPEKKEENSPELDDQGIFNRTFDTVFSLSKDCPADIPFELNAHYFQGSFTISLRWLCIIFTALGYPLQFLCHCIGVWILYETVVRKEIKA